MKLILCYFFYVFLGFHLILYGYNGRIVVRGKHKKNAFRNMQKGQNNGIIWTYLPWIPITKQ
jgi:hypothetical protein